MDGFIGEIRLFAPSFAPKYWAYCTGQILALNQNQALFSILGTTYGGNGINNFALPDLRGKAPVGVGQGAGLTNYILGQQTGTATNTLTGSNLPPHNHTIAGTINMRTTTILADSETPGGNYFANDATTKFDAQNDGTTMKPAIVDLTAGNPGAGFPVNNMMPYMAINYIICLSGVFPSRN
jgi:microcystin-dependent protein